jgi:hypothetical protein
MPLREQHVVSILQCRWYHRVSFALKRRFTVVESSLNGRQYVAIPWRRWYHRVSFASSLRSTAAASSLSLVPAYLRFPEAADTITCESLVQWNYLDSIHRCCIDWICRCSYFFNVSQWEDPTWWFRKRMVSPLIERSIMKMVVFSLIASRWKAVK